METLTCDDCGRTAPAESMLIGGATPVDPDRRIRCRPDQGGCLGNVVAFETSRRREPDPSRNEYECGACGRIADASRMIVYTPGREARCLSGGCGPLPMKPHPRGLPV